MMANKSGLFRTDINGLRAWAVLSVVLFHFGVPGFNGGFIGVDIFFVISGFLMTGIILNKLITPPLPAELKCVNKFDVIEFYLARARRILPALIVLCICMQIIGWFYLSAPDYRMLGTHIITALVFISNIKFWREAGYFDMDSHEKLLLHTWSLSVEWQFYILFPLVLVVLWKLAPNRKFMGIMLMAGFLLSLITSVIMTSIKPSAAFYLLPTRAWEMLAGGLVYFYAHRLVFNKNLSRGFELVGFGLILLSLFFFDSSTPWPGYHALVPIIGSVLILLAGRHTSFLTGTRLAQWLGKTSYSVYLWHWPFSVALIFLELSDNWLAIFGALVMTLLFGWASWALIEQPVRNGLVTFKKLPQMALISVIVLVVGVPALIIRLQDGIYGRFDAKVDAIFAESKNRNPRMDQCHSSGEKRVPGCTYGGDRLGVIVIGDSHALSVVTAVANSLPSKELHALEWSRSGCRTIKDLIQERANGQLCGQHIADAIKRSRVLDSSVPILIVNRISAGIYGPNEGSYTKVAPTEYISGQFPSRTPEYFAEMQKGMIATACAFADHRPVYMLRPIPELKVDVPRIMGRAAILGKVKRVSISVEEYDERHKIAMEAQDRAAAECGVILLDPRPYLCADGRCWGDVDGIPVYSDDDHLSERGGQLLIPLFKQMFASEGQVLISQDQ